MFHPESLFSPTDNQPNPHLRHNRRMARARAWTVGQDKGVRRSLLVFPSKSVGMACMVIDSHLAFVVGAGLAVLDPQKKVLYVAAYDAATGRDAVLEVDPLNPSGHLVGSEASLTRGWGSLEGPRITSTTMVPEAFYCGSAGAFAATPADSSASSTCSAIEHPRAQGHSNASTSGGWYSVYRGLAMDLSGALTGCTLHTTCITRLR